MAFGRSRPTPSLLALGVSAHGAVVFPGNHSLLQSASLLSSVSLSCHVLLCSLESKPILQTLFSSCLFPPLCGLRDRILRNWSLPSTLDILSPFFLKFLFCVIYLGTYLIVFLSDLNILNAP